MLGVPPAAAAGALLPLLGKAPGGVPVGKGGKGGAVPPKVRAKGKPKGAAAKKAAAAAGKAAAAAAAKAAKAAGKAMGGPPIMPGLAAALGFGPGALPPPPPGGPVLPEAQEEEAQKE